MLSPQRDQRRVDRSPDYAASERAFVRVVLFFSAQALVVSKIVLHVGSTPFVSWIDEWMDESCRVMDRLQDNDRRATD